MISCQILKSNFCLNFLAFPIVIRYTDTFTIDLHYPIIILFTFSTNYITSISFAINKITSQKFVMFKQTLLERLKKMIYIGRIHFSNKL